MSDVNPTKHPPLAFSLLRLARVHQWSKSVFVFIGPFYAYTQGGVGLDAAELTVRTLIAAACFALASSGCYVFNDLMDAQADRAHPRKRRRPIASGAVSRNQALVFGVLLLAGAAGMLLLLPGRAGAWLGVIVGVYVVSVQLYSLRLKHIAILDVLILSLGFVLRVLGGCAAVSVTPSTWLLNSTLFLSMFLAFGKRLGERRSLGEEAANARLVQGVYSDQLLRMVVVVTAVATLLTYAGYVQAREDDYRISLHAAADGPGFGLNLLWLTMLPAVYALLRAITLLEKGEHDDPTELAMKDPPFQAGALLFLAITAALAFWGPMGGPP